MKETDRWYKKKIQPIAWWLQEQKITNEKQVKTGLGVKVKR